jgi:hypothetical protein
LNINHKKDVLEKINQINELSEKLQLQKQKKLELEDEKFRVTLI